MTRSSLIIACSVLKGIIGPEAVAQQTQTVIFSQIADGVFDDGSYYRTTIDVVPLSSGDMACEIDLHGLEVDFGSGRGSQIAFEVPGAVGLPGVVSMRSSADGPIRTGYATLTCDNYFQAQSSFAVYSSAGTKMAEATVLPTYRDVQAQAHGLVIDTRDGARVGLAIANDNDFEDTYWVQLLTTDGLAEGPERLEGFGEIVVGAKSNRSESLDEFVVPPPEPDRVYLMLIYPRNFSGPFSLIGLRYTGVVFSTVPVIW